MVQSTFSVSLGKEFSHQSIDLEEITYCFETFLSQKVKKRCLNSITEENVVNCPLWNE